MTKLDDRVSKRQLLQERKNRHKKPEDSARLLKFWLSETESSVELAHVLQSLQDNRKNSEHLPLCSDVIVKFTYKALQTNRTIDWLKSLEQVLEDYQQFGEVIPANLYISKYRCLKQYNNFDLEAENCLHKSIFQSHTNVEKIQAYFLLSQYYEDISEYKKMKNIILTCEEICTRTSDAEKYLAITWVILGHYYFRQFKFHESRKYFIKAKSQLELLCQEQNHKLLFRQLSDCLHYLGRIYFEEYEFVKSASFYIESQKVLEEGCQQNNLTLELGATAFYHLRLGQALEACKIKDSAKYHYDKSRIFFNRRDDGSSSVIHIKLALANLVGSDSPSLYSSAIQNFQKEERQIQEAAKQASKTGYPRGYLMALKQLLSLYIENRKIHLVMKVIWDILVSKEFNQIGGIVFSITLIYKVWVKKIYYRIKYKVYRKFRVNNVLFTCPCSDPKCKSHKE